MFVLDIKTVFQLPLYSSALCLVCVLSELYLWLNLPVSHSSLYKKKWIIIFFYSTWHWGIKCCCCLLVMIDRTIHLYIPYPPGTEFKHLNRDEDGGDMLMTHKTVYSMCNGGSRIGLMKREKEKRKRVLFFSIQTVPSKAIFHQSPLLMPALGDHKFTGIYCNIPHHADCISNLMIWRGYLINNPTHTHTHTLTSIDTDNEARV